MRRKAPRLIFDIHDDRVDIFLESQKVTEIWIDTEGVPHCTPWRNIWVLERSPISPSDRRLIEVQTLVTKRDTLGLPRLHEDRGAIEDTIYVPDAPPPRPRPDAENADSIDKHTADLILDRVLKSYVRNPIQNSRVSAQETNDIAAELNVRKYAVAGVKAALTRGVYGEKDALIQQYRQAAIIQSRRAAESKRTTVGRRAPSAEA